jgi:hypothetical protein
MKTKLPRYLFPALIAALLACGAPGLSAQDEKKEDAPKEEQPKDEPKGEGEKKDPPAKPEREKEEKPKDEPDADGPPEFDAEEFRKRSKEEEKERDATIKKMLRVFKPLEGEWTGIEKVEHRDPRFKALDKDWKDTWKGFFTVDGRYFEMTGQTEGDDPTSYRWVCTWDAREETYKAWYFGETSQTLYTGELSNDRKYVVWTVVDEENETQTRFSMIPDGDRVKCSGTDRIQGQLWSRQTSNYTRKKVDI